MYLIDRTGALCFAVDADNKKSVLKTISAMDLDKINMDLVESLLEWIVDGKHDYPPGKNHPCILRDSRRYSILLESFSVDFDLLVYLFLFSVSRRSARVSAWPG